MLRPVVLAVAAALFALGLAGCATQGNPSITDHGLYMRLKLDESTKADVYRQLHQPHDVIATYDDHTSWVYLRVDSRTNVLTFVPLVGLFAGGSDDTIHRSVLTFSPDGVLRSVRTMSRDRYMNTWAGLAVGVNALATDEAEGRVRAEMARLGIELQAPTIKGIKAYD